MHRGHDVLAIDDDARAARRPQRDVEHGAPIVTDNGNRILDCRVGPITDARALDATIRALPGVVGTGLFVGMAPTVLVWDGARCRMLRQQSPN